MDNFDLKKYLVENRMKKETKSEKVKTKSQVFKLEYEKGGKTVIISNTYGGGKIFINIENIDSLYEQIKKFLV